MHKKLLLNLALCLSIFSAAADNIADQLQSMNDSQIMTENDMWQRMRDGFALDHSETKEVKYWEKRYGSPKYFNIIMQNAAPYLFFVVSEMERRGIPSELALIPIVESTYNPNAISPAAISTGMWQFLAGSGKRFGMTLNPDLDERKDIIKSTRGAISYLQYLHDMFGSWELAIAAYNWGEGNINTAIVNSSSQNFYALDVRDVTHQYVPKIIALANIIQNPGKFGIKMTNLANAPYFAIINPPTPLSVSNFMLMANLSANENKKLNPQYNSLNYLVNPNQRLLLPVSQQPTFLASLGGKQPTPIIAPVAPAIASATNPQANNQNSGADDGIAMLAAADKEDPKLSNPSPAPASGASNQVAITDLLDDKAPVAPAAAAVVTAPANSNPSSNAFISYTVSAGDTLYSIARKFAVPIASIKSDNQLVDNTVKLNQKLIIHTNGTSS